MRLRLTPLLVSVAFLSAAMINASNFTQCLASVRNGEFGTGQIGATDNKGNILDDVRNATGVTYHLCLRACGSSAEAFHWPDFSQQFTSWLLPWLALISQLPFGPQDKLENMESVFLTIGSPTLAAYSLALTILNTRWIARRFSKHAYPNVRNAVRALTSLQQAPLRVSNDSAMLASLVVLPQNDKWWREIIQWLQYPHTWSVSAVTSVIWVTIAFVFTVVNSFTGDLTERIKASGQGVGSVWLWLLPIVVGWLQVSPKCDEERLRNAVDRANALAHIAVDSHSDPVPARQLSQHRAIYLALAEESDDDSELRADERITAPIYNYSRFLPWVQSVEEHHRKSRSHNWMVEFTGITMQRLGANATFMAVNLIPSLMRSGIWHFPAFMLRLCVEKTFPDAYATDMLRGKVLTVSCIFHAQLYSQGVS